MANRKHLKILKKGVRSWNHWRKENPTIKPNIKGANLAMADLKGVDFSGTNIKGVNFRKADLAEADFSHCTAGVRSVTALFSLMFLLLLSFMTGFLFYINFYLGFYMWSESVYSILSNQDIVSRHSNLSAFSGYVFYFGLIFVVLIGLKRLTNWGVILAVIFWSSLFAAGAVAGFELLKIISDQFSIRMGSIALGAFWVTGLSLFIIWALIVTSTFYMNWGFAWAHLLIVVLFLWANYAMESVHFMFLLAGILVILAMVFYICWRTVYRDAEYLFLKNFGLTWASFRGTNFQGADLSHANFTGAVLKNTRFDVMTNLHQVCWKKAEKLNFARLSGTQLDSPAVRVLLTTGDGKNGVFRHMNFHGAYLVGADLRYADFSHSLLSKAVLSKARMTGVNLHGAFFKGWRTDQVECDYVYLDAVEENRVPFPEEIPDES